jgi:hypothetical protein
MKETLRRAPRELLELRLRPRDQERISPIPEDALVMNAVEFYISI